MQFQVANQDIDKRDQEQEDLYWFTLPQELHVISLSTSKEIPLKNQLVQLIQQSHTLAPCMNIHCAEPYCTSTSIKPIHLQQTNTLNHCTIKNKTIIAIPNRN